MRERNSERESDQERKRKRRLRNIVTKIILAHIIFSHINPCKL